ncbi:MAG: biopolymer transporter ExbD [Hyphomicrobiales bacterium]|nr:MAG: biopolymer transporter ExbD [Hyphomicrobiales bacterium]
MRLADPQHKLPVENILPLINIVFLMLIFFLVAATLKPFSELNIAPPVRDGSGQQETIRDTVLVDGQGRISYEGALVTPAELTERLRIRLQMGQMPRLKVLADRKLGAADLVDVLAAATAAGAKHVSLITIKGSG